jgi:SAM-dependent methyltransferase
MDRGHLDELIQLEESYWWHVAKRELVTAILRSRFPAPAHVVEGGIGSSRNLLEFRRLGYEVTGLDIMAEAVDHGRRRGLNNVHRHDLSEPWPCQPGSVSAVVLLDVLEHMADPVKVLRHAAHVLRPGGGLVLTVPAYPFLYSDWDKSLGHYRRYTAGQLRQDVADAGLTTQWVTHWNAFSLPAAIAVRSMQRCFPRERAATFPRISPAMNEILLKLASVERWCLRKVRVPVGLSLVGVLTK